MRPLFTVNIAVYNQLENLKVILEALRLQTFQDFEITITDDGSSDGTNSHLWHEHPLADRIHYMWQQDEGFRLAASKNMGIKEANGLYFLSLEGDVIPNNRLLESYLSFLNPSTVLLGVRHEVKERPSLPLDFFDLDTKVFQTDFREPVLVNWDHVEKPYMYASGCNLLLPTDPLKEIGGWDEEYKGYGKDDLDVAMRLMHFKGIKIRPCLSAYCYHIDHPHGYNQDSEDRFYAKEKELGL